MEATEFGRKRSQNARTTHDLAHIFFQRNNNGLTSTIYHMYIWKYSWKRAWVQLIEYELHFVLNVHTMLKCKWIRGDVFWLLLHKKNTLQTKYLWILLPAFIHYA